MSTEPMRPSVVETVFYEPDQREVIAVLSGALWLAAGDIVELNDPPRDARVLSARLQLERNEARVLIVLDVADDAGDALRGATRTEDVLGAGIHPSLPTGDELDEELEKLADEVVVAPAPDET
jgi:hypothetical protein